MGATQYRAQTKLTIVREVAAAQAAVVLEVLLDVHEGIKQSHSRLVPLSRGPFPRRSLRRVLDFRHLIIPLLNIRADQVEDSLERRHENARDIIDRV